MRGSAALGVDDTTYLGLYKKAMGHEAAAGQGESAGKPTGRGA